MQALDLATERPRGYLLLAAAAERSGQPEGLDQLLQRLQAAGAGQCLKPQQG